MTCKNNCACETELKTLATASLQAEVKKELEAEDPEQPVELLPDDTEEGYVG